MVGRNSRSDDSEVQNERVGVHPCHNPGIARRSRGQKPIYRGRLGNNWRREIVSAVQLDIFDILDLGIASKSKIPKYFLQAYSTGLLFNFHTGILSIIYDSLKYFKDNEVFSFLRRLNKGQLTLFTPIHRYSAAWRASFS